MIDFFSDNKSCSTNGADVVEEGVIRYYFKHQFEKEIRSKVTGDFNDSFTVSMGQLVL